MNRWIRVNLKRNSSVEEFCATARELQQTKELSTPEGLALFELYVSFPDYVVSLLFAIWAKAQRLKLIAYTPLRSTSKLEIFSFRLFSALPIDNGVKRPFRIFRSFGVTEFILPSPRNQANDLAQFEYQRVKKLGKFEIISYELFGIRVGDIFYDHHLRQRSLVTIDASSEEFKKDFIQFISNFAWWYNYFSENDIRLVCVSHSVYKQAITARLGLHFDAKVFVTSASRIYRLTHDHLWADTEFLEYNPRSTEQFGYLIDFNRAKEGLAKLKSGGKITAAHYAVSGYSGSLSSRVVKENNKTKILIAAHCFSDAPHSYGDMLFPDFDDWLTFLHNLSLNTDYDWYIKSHPAFYESDKHHFRKYLSIFDNFTEISPAFSNSDLIEQGIDVVLTVYGTIAFEAAELGALVVCASKRAPHGNYSFTLSPETMDDYEEILLNLDRLKKSHEVSRNEVHHFFDLHHLRTSKFLFFGEDFDQYLAEIGGYDAQFTNPNVLKYWKQKYARLEYVRAQVYELDLFINSDRRSFRDFGIRQE